MPINILMPALSPGLTASPSFLCHLARLPSVMVGDSSGMRISIGTEI